MAKPKFEAPQIQGPYDPHPETPPTGLELDAADRDVRFPGQRHLQQMNAEINAEPQTPEQLEQARIQALALAQRYSQKPKHS